MKGTIDNYLVELDCLYEKGMLVGSGLASSQTFDKKLAGNDDQMLYNPAKFKRTYGEIKAVPQRLSDIVVDDRDGVITKMSDVYSGTMEQGWRAHFFWTATSPDMLVDQERSYGHEDGIRMKYLFRIPAHRLICSSKDGIIKMNGDYILLKPILEDESEIKTASGIYLKESATPRHLEGTVTHSNCSLVGKKVMHYPDANAEIEINGETYYAMRKGYVMAIIGDELLPYDDKMLVQADEQKKFYENGLEIPENCRKESRTGVVLKIGSGCNHLSVGDRIQWEGPKIEVVGGHIVREGQVAIKFFSDQTLD